MNKQANSLPLTDAQLSKKLSWLLRHGAVKENIAIQSNGFVPVDSILRHPKYSHDYTLAVLQHLVAIDRKSRYTLRQNPQNGTYEIRANQGHSLEAVHSDECLEKVVRLEDVPLAVHGTYYRHWASIRKEGLKRMRRLHIHFATYDVSETRKCSSNGISGFRSDSQILIYLNVRKVMQESSMEIYKSANNVILCSGIDGCIPKEYFAKVLDRRTRKLLDF